MYKLKLMELGILIMYMQTIMFTDIKTVLPAHKTKLLYLTILHHGHIMTNIIANINRIEWASRIVA
jgi:hypothetical protein